jgi:FtsH-binding integral membrane protein
MQWQQQIALDAGQVSVANATVDERLVFLRKTYLLVLTGLGFAAVGGWVGATTLLESVVRFWWLYFIGYFIGMFVVRGLRRVPGVNYAALFGYTFLCGLLLGPLLFYAVHLANGKPTIVINALVITGTAITGLSGYVLVTRKDFSFLRGALAIGSMILLGVIVVSLFTGGFSFNIEMAISIFGAVLFSGFILYDTSRIVRSHPTDDSIGAAIDLFLDFFLLFLYVLRILVMIAASRD